MIITKDCISVNLNLNGLFLVKNWLLSMGRMYQNSSLWGNEVSESLKRVSEVSKTKIILIILNEREQNVIDACNSNSGEKKIKIF